MVTLFPGAVVVFNLPRGVKPLTGDNIMVKANGGESRTAGGFRDCRNV